MSCPWSWRNRGTLFAKSQEERDAEGRDILLAVRRLFKGLEASGPFGICDCIAFLRGLVSDETVAKDLLVPFLLDDVWPPSHEVQSWMIYELDEVESWEWELDDLDFIWLLESEHSLDGFFGTEGQIEAFLEGLETSNDEGFREDRWWRVGQGTHQRRAARISLCLNNG